MADVVCHEVGRSLQRVNFCLGSSRFAFIADICPLNSKFIVDSALLLNTNSFGRSFREIPERCSYRHYIFVRPWFHERHAKLIRRITFELGLGYVLADGEEITVLLGSVIQGKPPFDISLV